MALVLVATAPQYFILFMGQIRYMKACGFRVHAVSSPGECPEILARKEHVPAHGVAMARRVSPVRDLGALARLWRLRPAIVPPRDAGALERAVRGYLDDPGLRREHGRAGRARVLRDFPPEVFWEAQGDEYVRLLGAKGLPLPRAGVGAEGPVLLAPGGPS